MTQTAGGAIFTKLGALGIDYVFTNSGTDYPPIIEGLLEAQHSGAKVPTPVIVPHEHAALGMAHGAWQISGRMQAVMLHTNVGLANGVIGAINAWCDQVPMLLMSGRTPVTEHSRFGARTVPIGWGQEMFDQQALIREVTKWDYELRYPEQLGPLMDRAWAIAQSTPQGAAFLGLPREVLCEPAGPATDTASATQPVALSPDPDALQRAAQALIQAKSPLVIAQRGTGSHEAFQAFTEFVIDLALPVSHYWANQIALPLDHPCQIGWNSDDLLAQADVILVLNSLAPWWPDHVTLRDDATVIQLGPDPLFTRTPVRSFPAQITLAGDTSTALLALIETVLGREPGTQALTPRRTAIAERALAERTDTIAKAEAGCTDPMTKDWVSLCLGRAIKGQTASVFHELGCPFMPLDLTDHLSYFAEPHSGGLGWGLPAAMGAQLMDPYRLVFATMGDGSYMFANPVACHQVMEALGLPVITLVLNNGEWGAVRKSVQGLYPGGLASRANEVPLTGLQPSPDFAMVAAASRAYSETVTEGAALPAALERAIKVARDERRQVLLNIQIRRD